MPGVAPPPTQELEGKAGKIGEQSNERTSLYLTSSHLLCLSLWSFLFTKDEADNEKQNPQRKAST